MVAANDQPVEAGSPNERGATQAIDWALAYRRLGWSVIPINQATKKPPKDFKWKQYQEEAADEATIRSWYARWPMAGVGIVTGRVSNLWVVDVDSADGFDHLTALDLPATPTVKTSKGEHRYFAHPGALRNTAKKVGGLDTRGEGGFVVAPPTIHPTGVAYAWGSAPWDSAPPSPPAALVALFAEARRVVAGGEDSGGEDNSYVELLANGTPSGQRHHDMARLVGHYLAHGIAPAEVKILLRPWVDRCQPPFPYHQLDTMVDDLAAAEARKRVETVAPCSPSADNAPIAGLAELAHTTDDGPLITVEPRFLAWLIQQTAATVELRARYHYVLAVARDPVMNEGQKLTEIVLFSHLPLPMGRSVTPPEPVTVAAATIAYDLGSPGTKQKDGSLRPTKLSTVTKNLGDLINLGVRTRDAVVTEKVITLPNKRDKTSPPIKKTITVTNYAYHGSGSLPGQRMTRDEARVAATRAKADRERPRCSRCYGARLKPRSYVCEDCGHESSSADAARAGRAIVEDSHGRFIHHATGEVIEPGVRVAGAGCPPVSSNRNPVTDRGRLSPEGSDTRDRIPVTVEADGGRGRGAGTHDRIPVTKKTSGERNWNPVTAPMLFPHEPSSVEDAGPAASTTQAVTPPAAGCAATSPPCVGDVAREREEEHGDQDADWI